jgi:hypothetical protein
MLPDRHAFLREYIHSPGSCEIGSTAKTNRSAINKAIDVPVSEKWSNESKNVIQIISIGPARRHKSQR